MATAQQFINKAASHIGISGTDNKFNTWYWGFRCYDANSYPWCATFMSYVANEIGLKFRKSASAAAFANQFPRVNDADVKPGDIVVYNWDGRNDIGWCDHVGVVEWFNHSSQLFGTIEGNTGNSAGGTVMRQTRNNNSSYFTAFFRPPYDGSSSSKPVQSTTVAPRKWDNGSGVKKPKSDNGQPVYNGMANFKWFDCMQGTVDCGGSGDDYAGELGVALQYIAIKGVKRYRTAYWDDQSNKAVWNPWVSKYDLADEENGCAGNGKAIIAVEIDDDKVIFKCHGRDEKKWFGRMRGLKDIDNPNEKETFGGDMTPIDAIQIKKA